MKRTPANLANHELIGLSTTVTRCCDPTLENISGDVVDETRNTIKIERNGVVKTVPKMVTTFSFTLGGEAVIVEGSAIQGRPEDRIARLRRTL